MKVDIQEFVDRNSLEADIAHRIGAMLTAGIKRNGRASLAVSGGSTPVELFKRLSELDIPWQQVVVTLVDERWVEPTMKDSNEYLARMHLLQDKAATATFIGMKNPAATAESGEEQCEQSLQQVPRPFDVLLLGMGSDGHTASLFPGADKLARATAMDSGKTCMGIVPLTAPYERITLTLPAILDSRQIFLHITGRTKRDVLRQALAVGPTEDMPIRYVLRQQATPLTVFWAP